MRDLDPREALAHIRARADAATEGPWVVDLYFWKPGFLTSPVEMLGVEATGGVTGSVAQVQVTDDEDRTNAEFIAAARTDVVHLVAAVEAALDAHPPYQMYGAAGAEYTACSTCRVPYPCPPVQKITDALNGARDN